MVDVVRCQTSHSGHAVPMPRPQCIEEGCTRPSLTRDRCSAHYQAWRKSPDFYPAPPPPPVPLYAPVCPWCGPHSGGFGISNDGERICSSCKLTPGEHAYIDRILADSSAVYAEEHRAYRAKGGR